jgi:hypothetical protein
MVTIKDEVRETLAPEGVAGTQVYRDLLWRLREYRKTLTGSDPNRRAFMALHTPQGIETPTAEGEK